MSELPKRIARNLIKLRTEHDRTQKEIAQFVGVTLATYRKWENAQTYISLHNAIKVAEIYNIPLSELFL